VGPVLASALLRMRPVFFCRLSSKVLVEVISDDHHRSIATCSLTLDLDNGELAVLGCLTRFDSAQCVANSIQNLRRTAQHARRCGADLNEMFSNGLTIEHGIKSRNLVHPHGGHRKKFSDIVHDADACPSLILPLCKVEQRNDGRFLVLRWVVGNDLISPCEVLGSELEGYLRVVVCGVPVDEDGVGGPDGGL